MEFNQFLSKISQIKNIIDKENYNGLELQKKMIPKERLNYDTSLIKNAKKAAVLALFYPKNNQTYLLLTLRANYKGTHAGQISFPGGKKDTSDINLTQTALRESKEEVGIDAANVDTIIPLTKVYIPPSNFWVSPFIGIAKSQPKFIKNYEVEELIEVKLTSLLNSNNVKSKNITTSYAENMNIPYFELNNYTVWGATAMILSEIKELINLTPNQV